MLALAVVAQAGSWGVARGGEAVATVKRVCLEMAARSIRKEGGRCRLCWLRQAADRLIYGRMLRRTALGAAAEIQV